MGRSHINGQPMYVFPEKKSRRRVWLAVTITGLMVAFDILCVAAVFYLKFYLVRVIHYYNGDVIAELVNAVQILVLAAIYSRIGTLRAFLALPASASQLVVSLSSSQLLSPRLLCTLHNPSYFLQPPNLSLSLSLSLSLYSTLFSISSLLFSFISRSPRFFPLILSLSLINYELALAKMLTEHENCRTQTQYEDSLIMKFFVFNFINSCEWMVN